MCGELQKQSIMVDCYNVTRKNVSLWLTLMPEAVAMVEEEADADVPNPKKWEPQIRCAFCD